MKTIPLITWDNFEKKKSEIYNIHVIIQCISFEFITHRSVRSDIY